jgi:hypothetical protein
MKKLKKIILPCKFFCPRRSLFVLLLWLIGCSRCETMDDETQLREIIEQTAQRAEAGDVDAILDVATEDFAVAPAGLSKKEARLRLALFFRQSGRVAIRYPRPTVNVDTKTKAYAEASVPFALRRKEKDFPDLTDVTNEPAVWIEKVKAAADLYHLSLWFIKQNGKWKVRKARIQKGF